MYDDYADRIILTNHSRPIGTAVADRSQDRRHRRHGELEDNAPEGAASDGKGKLFVNNEGKNTIQVLDAKTMEVASRRGRSLRAMARPASRTIARTTGSSPAAARSRWWSMRRPARSWRRSRTAMAWTRWAGIRGEKLIYIPAGRDGNVTVVHQDSPDKYTVVATVPTMAGTKTMAVDPVKHVVYALALEYGPAPAPARAQRHRPAGAALRDR